MRTDAGDEAPADVGPALNVAAALGCLLPARWASLGYETGGRIAWLIAEGSVVEAGDMLARLETGPEALELALLRARVAQGEATVQAAEATRASATLVAPFAGTVAGVNFRPGEVVIPGQSVLSLGDLTMLQLETTDLNEADAAQIGAGIPVTVTFDALPGYLTGGTTTHVAPMASSGQGGTNYRLVVQLETVPQELRWGMTAFVGIPLD